MFFIVNLNITPLDANGTDPDVDEELELLPPPAPLAIGVWSLG
jgi:hypothetical protein